MPDLDSTLRDLSRLAERPPADPSSVEELAGRARTIRRRRAAMTATPLVALVALLGVMALSNLGDDDRLGSVAVEPVQTTAPDSGSGFVVIPDSGLAGGDRVEVRTDDHQGPLVAAQCASSAFTEGGGRFCDGMTFQVLRSGDGEPLQPIEVRRFVQTHGGFVDCTESAGRCHLVVAEGTLDAWDEATTRSAPLTFDPARAVDPSIEVRDEVLVNGEVTVITGRGFPAGHEVWISQCLPGGSGDNDLVEPCDSLRGAYTTVLDDGMFSIKFQVSQDIRLREDESWSPCLDCEIAVGFAWGPSVRAPIRIVPNDELIRPTFEILEAGPYTPGQRVTLVGTGFQNGGPPLPGWCMLNTEEPYPACSYPDEAFHPLQSQIDTFTFPDFPMPSGAWADVCLAHPESDCAIAWVPATGSPPTAILRYELIPG